MESRLADIEVKLNFCEDLLEEFNRTVYRQQQQIELMQEEMQAQRRAGSHFPASRAPQSARRDVTPLLGSAREPIVTSCLQWRHYQTRSVTETVWRRSVYRDSCCRNCRAFMSAGST
jgi:SlyX protein